jgi:diaminohydroxyphosphoribosylaminopyrimidine deaminase/5-amino-6-(5-phosphoribosylamino)uracil reductase
VLVATQPYPPADKAHHLKERGVDFIWLPPAEDGALDLSVLLDELGQRGLLYLLVEGGANVFSSFIRNGLYDDIVLVTAPIIVGGDGIPSVTSLGLERVSDAVKLRVIKRKAYGSDMALWLRPASQG